MPIGFGSEEMEAVILVDVLRRAGAEVTLASVEQRLEVEFSGGTRLVADAFASACSDQIFDLIALPVGFSFCSIIQYSAASVILCFFALSLLSG